MVIWETYFHLREEKMRLRDHIERLSHSAQIWLMFTTICELSSPLVLDVISLLLSFVGGFLSLSL